MTAEERLRLACGDGTASVPIVVSVQDVSELLSTLDALRKSYEERGQAITVLAKGWPRCEYCGREIGETE